MESGNSSGLQDELVMDVLGNIYQVAGKIWAVVDNTWTKYLSCCWKYLIHTDTVFVFQNKSQFGSKQCVA